MGVIRTTIRLSIALVRIAFRLAVGLAELLFWTNHLLRQLGLKAGDAGAAIATSPKGVWCPRGHAVDDRGTWQCEACGWVYDGSAWLCPNPECGATTPYLACGTCGRAVRSPYRWGDR